MFIIYHIVQAQILEFMLEGAYCIGEEVRGQNKMAIPQNILGNSPDILIHISRMISPSIFCKCFSINISKMFLLTIVFFFNLFVYFLNMFSMKFFLFSLSSPKNRIGKRQSNNFTEFSQNFVRQLYSQITL